MLECGELGSWWKVWEEDSLKGGASEGTFPKGAAPPLTSQTSLIPGGFAGISVWSFRPDLVGAVLS